MRTGQNRFRHKNAVYKVGDVQIYLQTGFRRFCIGCAEEDARYKDRKRERNGALLFSKPS